MDTQCIETAKLSPEAQTTAKPVTSQGPSNGIASRPKEDMNATARDILRCYICCVNIFR